jgi:Domain of unknown function (DUF4326)
MTAAWKRAHLSVWNKRDPDLPLGAVYIGRPTIFGNPFSHMSGTAAEFKVADRAAAVAAFERYATERMSVDPKFASAVRALAGKDLVCWCAPHLCHGEVLVRLSNLEVRS